MQLKNAFKCALKKIHFKNAIKCILITFKCAFKCDLDACLKRIFDFTGSDYRESMMKNIHKDTIQ